MNEVPLDVKAWSDSVIPERIARVESQLTNIGDYLHLIYELLKPPNTEGTEEMPAPLRIGLEVPTGANFDFPDNFNNWSGQNWIRDRLDSDLGIDGHKVFTFESFDLTTSLSDGYNFTVDIDPAFTTVDTASTPYISCHIFNPVRIAKLGLQILGGWADDRLGIFPDDLAGRVKESSLVGELSATPAEIKVNPNLLNWAGFFSVKVQDEGWKSAVINYEQANGKFIILGY